MARQPNRKSKEEKTGASGSQCERIGSKEKHKNKDRLYTQEKEEKKYSGQFRKGFKERKTPGEPEARSQQK